MSEEQRVPVGNLRSRTRPIPQATVSRLATYLRVLGSLDDDGVTTVSSEALASAAGVGSATLRKDLSFLGPTGVRGVGYDVRFVRTRIEATLGLDVGHRVVLVGLGYLGSALASYRLDRLGFTTVGLFDSDASRVGTVVDRLVVRPVAELVSGCRELDASVGVIATPDASAQAVADELVKGGVRSILSFAQGHVRVPPHVEVKNIDLALELQVLSFNSVRNGLVGDRSPRLGRAACAPQPVSNSRNGSVIAP
ncbi:redox-sensing transcriptional repressor Rex [Actinomycetes bacterium M1A6_2h]